MRPKKTVLFISHEASFTGAPILLLHLIALIHARNEFQICTLCVRGGDLTTEFARYGECYVLKNEDMYHEVGVGRRLVNRLSFLFRLGHFIPKWQRADVVFNNTIGNGKVLRVFSRFRELPVTSYIHELEESIQHAACRGEAQLTFELSRKILSPSEYNRKILQDKFKLCTQKTGILRYLIRTQLDSNELRRIPYLKEEYKRAFCNTYSIPADARLVLGMGTFDSRKAVDLFAATANLLKNQQIHFVWIGMSKDADFRIHVEEFVREHDVSNFHYLGPQPHDLHNFLPFDLLFLSSREDPYPLVVLEAASLEIPCIFFRGSGGIIDFVTDREGWEVDDFSIHSAASLICNIQDTELRSKGRAAQQKVLAWHFDEDAIYNSFCSLTGLK